VWPSAKVTVTRCIAKDEPPGIRSTTSTDLAPAISVTHSNASNGGAASCKTHVASPSSRPDGRDTITTVSLTGAAPVTPDRITGNNTARSPEWFDNAANSTISPPTRNPIRRSIPPGRRIQQTLITPPDALHGPTHLHVLKARLVDGCIRSHPFIVGCVAHERLRAHFDARIDDVVLAVRGGSDCDVGAVSPDRVHVRVGRVVAVGW
jgi:hypothetical protein